MATKMKKKAKSASKARKPAKAAAKKAAPAAPAFSGKQQFIDSFAKEMAKTLQVLRALPSGQGEFRPHERSKNARELAWTFVVEQYLMMKAMLNQPFNEGSPPQAPTDYDTVITRLENDHMAIVQQVKKTPDAWFSGTLQFPVGKGKMGDWKRSDFMWFLLSDHIHHRGQFTVYLRMAGGKVPSIYGPSADEPWR